MATREVVRDAPPWQQLPVDPNVIIPKRVLTASASADALHKQLYGGGETPASLPEQMPVEPQAEPQADPPAAPALVAQPAEWAARVDAFLGGGLDTAAMAAAVDGSLHRQVVRG